MDVVLAAMIATHSVRITPEVLQLIASIDEFKGAWRALGTLAPDRLSATTPGVRGEGRREDGCLYGLDPSLMPGERFACA